MKVYHKLNYDTPSFSFIFQYDSPQLEWSLEFNQIREGSRQHELMD